TGRAVTTDEDKALASWYWRNLNYWHGEEGLRNCFSGKFGGDKGREYWTGLFGDGFALCGTTHAQWSAEMEALLGHCRSRVAGVEGHNSFEVYLAGGAYGAGRWALLDHDISTVIYDRRGERLLALQEIIPAVKELANPTFDPARQHGWRASGLHDDDARGVYTMVDSVEYLAGYAGPPPMVHLRSGESLRRYLRPGLEDGKTFVFWGRNYDAKNVPGPTRDRTWVNQPDKMYRSKKGAGSHDGQARYANAVYSYAPDFAGGTYHQGVIDEAADHVTFEFYTPYVIAAMPANTQPWGVYDAGAKNGLVLHVQRGPSQCTVQVSTDQGKTWQEGSALKDGLDLTDGVKGCQQYLLRFNAGVTALKDTGVSWTTVCQANVCTMPHLHEGDNAITYAVGGRGIVSAGPLAAQAEAHVVEGKLGSPKVTLELTAPRGAKPVHLYAAAWQASGAPPAPVNYAIDRSIDGGKTWASVVKNWKIERHPPEPTDFWSQSFTWADADLEGATAGTPVRVRFTNDGGKSFRKAEASLAYEVTDASPTEVSFCWSEGSASPQTAIHTYAPPKSDNEDGNWHLKVSREPQTLWVEIRSK
ncbi:MAG: hypothetical protein JWN51_2040, partial [Phycisphaerales bacterium]|nr:hypothetical protein [Phycisphaerales bacterium]